MEGIVLGVAFFGITKALICNKLATGLTFIGLTWIILLVFETLREGYLRPHPNFFIIYVPLQLMGLLLMRAAILLAYFQRLLKGPKLLWLKLSVIILLFIPHIVFTILLTNAVRCTEFIPQCTTPPPFETITLFDIIFNVSYLSIVLLADISFMVIFTHHLFAAHGGVKALIYRPFVYHVFLQCLIVIFIGLDIFRLSLLNIANIGNAIAPLNFYPDTFLILSLLDYGVGYGNMVKLSTQDKTPEQLEMMTIEKSNIELTKDSILKYLHHSFRNNIQRFSFHLQSFKQSMEGDTFNENLRKLNAFENIILYFSTLVDDVQTLDIIQSHKFIELKTSVFDIVILISEEFYTLRKSENEQLLTKIILELPESCFIIEDKGRLRQFLNLIYDNFVESDESLLVTLTVEDSVFTTSIRTVPGMCKMEKLIKRVALDDLDDFFLVSFQILDSIVEAMAGTIEVNDEENLVTFQIQLIEAAVINVNLDDDDSSSTKKRSIHRVLIVDDSLVNRKLMRKMISTSLEEGVIIEEAENGQEAIDKLEKMEAEDQLCELVLLDVMMPIMDGKEACRIIKEKWKERLKVVVLTANEQETLEDVPYDDYMQKPCRRPEVEAVLKRHFSQK